MKTKAKIQNVAPAPQAVPVSQPEVHAQDVLGERHWASCPWSMLLDLVKEPTPDRAMSAFSNAFNRTVAMTRSMTPVSGSSLPEDDWSAITEIFELDANVMREAFEVMCECWRRLPGGELFKMPPDRETVNE